MSRRYRRFETLAMCGVISILALPLTERMAALAQNNTQQTEDETASSAIPAGDAGDEESPPAVRAIVGEEGGREVVVENSPPVVANMRLSGALSPGEPRVFPFPASDPDPFDRLTFTILSQPASGLVINNGDGTFTFDPQSDFDDLAADQVREVQFTFRASDTSGAAREGTVTIPVSAGGSDATAQTEEGEAQPKSGTASDGGPATSEASADEQQQTAEPAASQEDKGDGPAATVGMTNSLEFTPAQVTISVGDTVLWRNNSDVVHTVTAIPSEAQDQSHVVLPEGAEPFGSGRMQPGDTFQHTFAVPGRYKYFCIPHESAGMIGEVIVEEKAAEPGRAVKDAGGQGAESGSPEETEESAAPDEGAEEVDRAATESDEIEVIKISAIDDRPEEVIRGEYLFHAGGCKSCHTAPDGASLAGGRALQTRFGTFHTPNITPDLESGLGRWTFEDFVRAMDEGLTPEGEPYYPAFPYRSFTRMYEFDLRDLWAYLRSVEPVENLVPPHRLEYPLDQRQLVHGWRLLEFEQGPAPAHPGRSALWNRGSYLVNALGHCGTCHTPKSEFGTFRDDMFLAGSEQIPGPFIAPNITPDPQTGIGEWSADEVAELLKTGERPGGGAVGGPMAEVVADSTSKLTQQDRLAIAEYLLSLTPVSHTPGN